ncbi:MAG: hypothetical protein J5I98_28630 [Phaeodactylibacter sp.]|nr:hypothetical protein [Phaeodactylibacter sp.]
MLRNLGENNVLDMAIDPQGGKLYWSDFSADKIFRVNLDGSSREEVVSNGSRLQGLAFNPDEMTSSNEEAKVKPFVLRAYPNPSSGIVCLDWQETINGQIEIAGLQVRDINGKLVWEQRISGGLLPAQITLPLKTGSYVLEAIGKPGIFLAQPLVVLK